MNFKKKHKNSLASYNALEGCIFLNLNVVSYPVWGTEAFSSKLKERKGVILPILQFFPLLLYIWHSYC